MIGYESNQRPDFRRRDFLRWSATTATGAAAVALTSCAERSTQMLDLDAPKSAQDATQVSCNPTRSDALGPFFKEGAPARSQIADENEPGERLVLQGQVFDEDCTTPIGGVLIDIWQADRDGGYHDANAEYRLRGQVMSAADGSFRVETILPGSYLIAENSWRPAHVHFAFSKPGFNSFPTQIYFAGDPFLPPNDGCGTCGSDDQERIVDLTGDAATGWQGVFRIVMARV